MKPARSHNLRDAVDTVGFLGGAWLNILAFMPEDGTQLFGNWWFLPLGFFVYGVTRYLLNVFSPQFAVTPPLKVQYKPILLLLLAFGFLAAIYPVVRFANSLASGLLVLPLFACFLELGVVAHRYKERDFKEYRVKNTNQ